MTTTVTISDEAKARAEWLIASGQFNTLEQVIEAATEHLAYCHGHEIDDDDEIDPDAEADALIDVSDSDREAIREGLHDIKAGRTLSADEVFDPLLARLRAMAESRAVGGGGR